MPLLEVGSTLHSFCRSTSVIFHSLLLAMAFSSPLRFFAAGVVGALEALLELGADAGATFTDIDGQVMTPLQTAGKNGVKATQDFFKERSQ